jgi:hypothetical protein
MPARRAAAAPCPASIVELDSSVGPFSTAGASFDSADANTHVTYDRVQCNTTLTSQSGGSASDFVRVVESFDVAGLAPGTPVATTVTFQLDGSVYQNCGAGGCGVEMSATLRSGVDSVTAAASIVGPTPPTTKPFAETLSLPVTLTAGTPVTVEFVLRYATGPGQEDANGTLTGRWSVIGLPAGASAVSCLGTTPVRTRSWGALKAHYR